MSPLLFKRLSDENLGSRLASGEAAAFDELYRRYAHRLSAYGSHLLGDAASGDDVAQAAMLKAYGALRDGRVPDKMKPWLYRIAHNAAIDLVARRRELSTETLPEQPTGEREPFAGALVEALATLPDRQRRVYILREVHGLRIDETASELGLSASQVEQSLFAARNRLAEQLVFGDRLNCVTVQRLSAGPLDASERRALKTHLRMCEGCRQSMGLRGRALSLYPSGAGFEWLRGLGAGLIGGGAPVAAKVGAVVATATIVGGGSVAVDQANHHPRRVALGVVRAAPVAHPARPRSSPRVSSAVQVSAVVPAVRKAVAVKEAVHRSRDEGMARESVAPEHDAQQAPEHDAQQTPEHESSRSSGDGSHVSAESTNGSGERSNGKHTAAIEHDSSHSDHEGSGKSVAAVTHQSDAQQSGHAETDPVETESADDHPSEEPTPSTVGAVSPLLPVAPAW